MIAKTWKWSSDNAWARCHRTEPPPGNFLQGREYPKDKHSPQSGFPRKISPPLVKILPPLRTETNSVTRSHNFHLHA